MRQESFREDHFKLDNKVSTFLRCFGEREAFSRDFPPHTRPDDIFEYNRDGPAVQSRDIHSATTESLPKANPGWIDDIRTISLEDIVWLVL